MRATREYSVDDLAAMGSDAPYELIEGNLVNWPPACLGSSAVGARLGAALAAFGDDNDLGIVTGAAGGYNLTRPGERATVIAPSVGFVTFDHIPNWFDFQGYFPGPPDLAVVVVSPMRSAEVSARRIDRLMAAGARLIWDVRPSTRTVIVRHPGQNPVTLGAADVLDGEDILPGFRLPVASVFREPGERKGWRGAASHADSDAMMRSKRAEEVNGGQPGKREHRDS